MLGVSPAVALAAFVCFTTLPGTLEQTTGKDCHGLLDVVAVVDGSGSIGSDDFNRTLEALVQLIHTLDVKSPDRRLGVVVFSSAIFSVVNLTGDAALLADSIGDIIQPRGGTLTHLGINRMTEMFAEFNRTDVPQVGIVITDGRSQAKRITLRAASDAKDAGINMFSIGIGSGVNPAEILGIASTPDQALNLTDFDELENAIVNLINDVCIETQTRPTGPCDGCKFDNGIGYNAYTECDKFIQCHETDTGSYDFVVKTCQYGTFWNQADILCDFLYNVDCPNDPCLENGKISYKTSGNCSQYYTCVNGRSRTASCQSGTSYQGGACVTDPICVKTSGSSSGGCEYTAVPGDVCQYNWVVNGVNNTFPCAPGTAFSPSSCSCVSNTAANCGNSCQPLVDIDFNTDEGVEYTNYGVVVSNGHAYFDGNSHIKILSLANVDFNSRLNIRLRFKGDNPTSNSKQAVVNNNDCNLVTTVSITTEGPKTSFLAVNTSGFEQSVTSTVPSPNASDWKVVEYDYKSGTLTGTVNGVSSSAPIAGPLKKSQCAFQFGRGDGLSGFKGYIDYIIVSRC